MGLCLCIFCNMHVFIELFHMWNHMVVYDIACVFVWVAGFLCLSAFCFVFTGVFIWVRDLCRAAPPQVFVYESGSCGDLSCKHTPVLRASWITLRRTSHSVSHIWTHLVTIHPLSQRSLASINNNESCNQRWNSQREPGVWSFISCIQFVVYNSFSCIC